jgi:hypothetical protein
MKLNTLIDKWMNVWKKNNCKFIDVMDQGKSMKSSNCVIIRTDFARNCQLVSQYDFAGVLNNRPVWCLYLGEEIPSGLIVVRTDNDEDTQTVIDVLGI